eukprot:scaffold1060_cov246-Pinguiococcus_pyrenoidosus.AAC.13
MPISASSPMHMPLVRVSICSFDLCQLAAFVDLWRFMEPQRMMYAASAVSPANDVLHPGRQLLPRLDRQLAEHADLGEHLEPQVALEDLPERAEQLVEDRDGDPEHVRAVGARVHVSSPVLVVEQRLLPEGGAGEELQARHVSTEALARDAELLVRRQVLAVALAEGVCSLAKDVPRHHARRLSGCHGRAGEGRDRGVAVRGVEPVADHGSAHQHEHVEALGALVDDARAGVVVLRDHGLREEVQLVGRQALEEVHLAQGAAALLQLLDAIQRQRGPEVDTRDRPEDVRGLVRGREERLVRLAERLILRDRVDGRRQGRLAGGVRPGAGAAHDRGLAQPVGAEEGQLSEATTGGDAVLELLVDVDVEDALLDGVEHVAHLALLHDDVAGHDLDALHAGDDLLHGVPREVGEEEVRAQALLQHLPGVLALPGLARPGRPAGDALDAVSLLEQVGHEGGRALYLCVGLLRNREVLGRAQAVHEVHEAIAIFRLGLLVDGVGGLLPGTPRRGPERRHLPAGVPGIVVAGHRVASPRRRARTAALSELKRPPSSGGSLAALRCGERRARARVRVSGRLRKVGKSGSVRGRSASSAASLAVGNASAARWGQTTQYHWTFPANWREGFQFRGLRSTSTIFASARALLRAVQTVPTRPQRLRRGSSHPTARGGAKSSAVVKTCSLLHALDSCTMAYHEQISHAAALRRGHGRRWRLRGRPRLALRGEHGAGRRSAHLCGALNGIRRARGANNTCTPWRDTQS